MLLRYNIADALFEAFFLFADIYLMLAIFAIFLLPRLFFRQIFRYFLRCRFR